MGSKKCSGSPQQSRKKKMERKKPEENKKEKNLSDRFKP